MECTGGVGGVFESTLGFFLLLFYYLFIFYFLFLFGTYQRHIEKVNRMGDNKRVT